MTKKIFAKDRKCIVCGKQAELFWPLVDPDIPAHPYCQKCKDEACLRALIRIYEEELK